MSTLERLQDMLIREYGLSREEISSESSLDTLGVDSLGMMELLFEIEKAFDIVIPNEQIELKTVGQVVAYINKLSAEQNGTPKLAVN